MRWRCSTDRKPNDDTAAISAPTSAARSPISPGARLRANCTASRSPARRRDRARASWKVWTSCSASLQPEGVTWQNVHHTHSSTVATNALIERRGARIGLITTAGFRDVLELQRLAIPHPMRFDLRRPEPLVPRALVREVRGRIGPDGSELEPLNAGGCGCRRAGAARSRRGDRRCRADPQLSQSGTRAADARDRRRGMGCGCVWNSPARSGRRRANTSAAC